MENEVFTVVATELRTQFPGIFVTGDSVGAPTAFPCVAFFEDDNYVSREDLDTADEAKIVSLRYRIDVYSNKTGNRKAEAKAILAAIEPLLYQRNFTRFSRTPLNDLGEKIYHVVSTYRVKTDGQSFYRV